jgi:hypothetical protein
MKLPSWLNWHTIAQAAATAVQIGNLATNIVPPKYQGTVLVVVSFAQWIMGEVAHYQQPPKP